jgi:hypothetical protein
VKLLALSFEIDGRQYKNRQFVPNLQHWVLKFGGQKQETYFQPFFKFLTLGLKFDNGHEEFFSSLHNFSFLNTFHFQVFRFVNISFCLKYTLIINSYMGRFQG